MSIPPGGEVGKETHKYTEQTLFFGTAEMMPRHSELPTPAPITLCYHSSDYFAATVSNI